MADNEAESFPTSARALEELAATAGRDLEEIALSLDRAALLCDQVGEVFRIHQPTAHEMNGTAELLRTKALQTRKQAKDVQAWLTGKAKAEVRVTHASDGEGSKLKVVGT